MLQLRSIVNISQNISRSYAAEIQPYIKARTHIQPGTDYTKDPFFECSQYFLNPTISNRPSVYTTFASVICPAGSVTMETLLRQHLLYSVQLALSSFFAMSFLVSRTRRTPFLLFRINWYSNGHFDAYCCMKMFRYVKFRKQRLFFLLSVCLLYFLSNIYCDDNGEQKTNHITNRKEQIQKHSIINIIINTKVISETNTHSNIVKTLRILMCVVQTAL